ncbi:hypothetical protein BT96DRAFT_1010055 [Gymnopus androsaceus JB14]|uniref:Uncharacterized protein n=1 Tax=Gymnopus androsaceus JB14 TaxID=1447944 RepID=A0A6A4GBB6_9AGAR|nr:hypothetical protein BT96DRAFT_1010055 [Gymnopus androsaceus JB14]
MAAYAAYSNRAPQAALQPAYYSLMPQVVLLVVLPKATPAMGSLGSQSFIWITGWYSYERLCSCYVHCLLGTHANYGEYRPATVSPVALGQQWGIPLFFPCSFIAVLPKL